MRADTEPVTIPSWRKITELGQSSRGHPFGWERGRPQSGRSIGVVDLYTSQVGITESDEVAGLIRTTALKSSGDVVLPRVKHGRDKRRGGMG